MTIVSHRTLVAKTSLPASINKPRPVREFPRLRQLEGGFSMSEPLSDQRLALIDASWRASNSLPVGQIYLMANPLLREPLRVEHIKPRLLGHWGTSPGQNFVYVHLNRLIRENDANIIYISGPGHGGPSVMAHTYLEGTYSEMYL